MYGGAVGLFLLTGCFIRTKFHIACMGQIESEKFVSQAGFSLGPVTE